MQSPVELAPAGPYSIVVADRAWAARPVSQRQSAATQQGSGLADLNPVADNEPARALDGVLAARPESRKTPMVAPSDAPQTRPATTVPHVPRQARKSPDSSNFQLNPEVGTLMSAPSAYNGCPGWSTEAARPL